MINDYNGKCLLHIMKLLHCTSQYISKGKLFMYKVNKTCL